MPDTSLCGCGCGLQLLPDDAAEVSRRIAEAKAKGLPPPRHERIDQRPAESVAAATSPAGPKPAEQEIPVSIVYELDPYRVHSPGPTHY